MLIEITAFRLADGADDQAFLAADERVRTGFLYQQDGLVRATTARGDDGEWVVIELWASAEHADAAVLAATDAPLVAAARALVDPTSVTRRRYETFD